MTIDKPKLKIELELPINYSVILNILTTANDSGSCNYFLKNIPQWLDYNWHEKMKATPDLLNTFEWILSIKNGDQKTITVASLIVGLAQMLKDEICGDYCNPYHKVSNILLGLDYGDCNFAQQAIQYAMYGKLVF